MRTGRRGPARRRRAVEQQLALLRPHLAADQAQHRGLAAAGRAHERRHLAARHGEAHVVEDAPRAVAEAQVRHSTSALVSGSDHPGEGQAEAGRE
jgi:hypothetical protein